MDILAMFRKSKKQEMIKDAQNELFAAEKNYS
jgi:hypothetical protein